MLSLVSLMVLAATIFELSMPARGDEAPAPQGQGASQDVKLTPEMQAVLAQLMKVLNGEQTGQAGQPAVQGQGGQQTCQASQQAQAAQSLQQFLKTLNNGQNGQGGQGGQATQNGQGGQAGNPEVNQLLPLVLQMLKTLDSQLTDDSQPTTTAANSDATRGDQKPHQNGGAHNEGLHSTGLTTHSLGNAPRMSNSEWRELFPQK